MKNTNDLNYIQMLNDWLVNCKNGIIDEDKYQIIIKGFDEYWQTICFSRQTTLDVLKNEKLQDELNDEIEAYNKLSPDDQLIHNIRQVKNFFLIKKNIYKLANFDNINKLTIEELEKSITQSRIIVSLHKFKDGNSKLPLYQNFINLQEQVLNLKKILNNVDINKTSSENPQNNLYNDLHKYDFWTLNKTKSLTKDNQEKLLRLLTIGIPYSIAMFEYLGFLKFLEFEKSMSKARIHNILASILNCTSQTVKGNMLTLNEYSKIDKTRYTAHLHKEKVKTDYYSLK